MNSSLINKVNRKLKFLMETESRTPRVTRFGEFQLHANSSRCNLFKLFFLPGSQIIRPRRGSSRYSNSTQLILFSRMAAILLNVNIHVASKRVKQKSVPQAALIMAKRLCLSHLIVLHLGVRLSRLDLPEEKLLITLKFPGKRQPSKRVDVEFHPKSRRCE